MKYPDQWFKQAAAELEGAVQHERRSFLSGAVPLAALAAGSMAVASAQSPKSADWTPEHHAQDNWMDEAPAKHRLAFDTVELHGFSEALAFASNYINVNRSAYGVESKDLAVIIIARHRSTPFAYNDAIWKKYGEQLADLAEFRDPKTEKAPDKNLFNAANYPELGTRGVTLDSLIAQGVRFGVCGMASQGISGLIAQATKGDASEIYQEIEANLIPNARIVPAGIVAISRAQERHFTVVSA